MSVQYDTMGRKSFSMFPEYVQGLYSDWKDLKGWKGSEGSKINAILWFEFDTKYHN